LFNSKEVNMSDHHWLTVHRARFADDVAGARHFSSGLANAICWRLGGNSVLEKNGVSLSTDSVWGMLSVFGRKQEAKAAVDTPLQHFPFLADAVESWHALLVPYSHHGSVNWRGTDGSEFNIKVASRDPGGPLAVLTTAGYASCSAEKFAQLDNFLNENERGLEAFGQSSGHVRGGFFVSDDSGDGVTCTLWKDDKEMLNALYGSGVHRELIASHANRQLFDRSSFTRTRIIQTSGKWDCENPAHQTTGS
jgi:hypothetical protein